MMYDYINVFFLIYFVKGKNLQESSADCFKLTNEILSIIKGNIILCKVPVL